MPSSRRLATKSSGETQLAGLKRFHLLMGWSSRFWMGALGLDFAFRVWGISTSHHSTNMRGSVYVSARVMYVTLTDALAVLRCIDVIPGNSSGHSHHCVPGLQCITILGRLPILHHTSLSSWPCSFSACFTVVLIMIYHDDLLHHRHHQHHHPEHRDACFLSVP